MRNLLHWGHGSSNFGAAYGEDTVLFDALASYAKRVDLFDLDVLRVQQRITMEVGNFSRYGTSTNYASLPTAVAEIKAAHETDSQGRWLWLRLVQILYLRDEANLSRYGLQDWTGGDGFKANFQAAFFRDIRSCAQNHCMGDSVKVYAQGLTAAQTTTACSRMNTDSKEFQDIFQPACVPLTNDVNNHLDVFIFIDTASCEDFQGLTVVRGAACSFGGVYYEFDPTDPSTTGQFFVKERNPDDPRVRPRGRGGRQSCPDAAGRRRTRAVAAPHRPARRPDRPRPHLRGRAFSRRQ